MYASRFVGHLAPELRRHKAGEYQMRTAPADVGELPVTSAAHSCAILVSASLSPDRHSSAPTPTPPIAIITIIAETNARILAWSSTIPDAFDKKKTRAYIARPFRACDYRFTELDLLICAVSFCTLPRERPYCSAGASVWLRSRPAQELLDLLANFLLVCF